MCGAISVSSCSDLIDSIFGNIDNVTKPDNKKNEEAKVAITLLNEALDEGSTTEVFFTYGGKQYVAKFSKVGENYLLVSDFNSGTSLAWQNTESMIAILQAYTYYVGKDRIKALLFSLQVDGAAVLQANINRATATAEIISLLKETGFQGMTDRKSVV